MLSKFILTYNTKEASDKRALLHMLRQKWNIFELSEGAIMLRSTEDEEDFIDMVSKSVRELFENQLCFFIVLLDCEVDGRLLAKTGRHKKEFWDWLYKEENDEDDTKLTPKEEALKWINEGGKVAHRRGFAYRGATMGEITKEEALEKIEKEKYSFGMGFHELMWDTTDDDKKEKILVLNEYGENDLL